MKLRISLSIALTLFVVNTGSAIDLTLEKTLGLVKKNNYEVKEVKWGEEVRKAQLSQAKNAYFPKLELMGIVAPMYKITGDVHGSTSDYGTWKPYYLLDAQLVFPIFTFFKSERLQDAARNGIEVAKSETKIKLHEVLVATKEYYYSYQLSRTMFGEAKSAKGILEDAIKKAKKMLKKNDIKKQDLLKLKVFYAQGMEKYELVKKGLVLAKAALAMQIGESQEVPIKVLDTKLLPVEFELKPLEHYVELAKEHRPEYKMAKFGLEATLALVEAEKANHLPNFFIGGQLKYRQTDNVTDQSSAFARDDYNATEPGVGLGLQWKWDYGTTKALTRKAKAEHMKVAEKARYAQVAIPMDIKRRYYELKEAMNNMENHKPGVKAAKEWKVIEVANYAIGINEAKDLLEALGADLISKFNYHNSVMKYNMAVAKLSAAVGKELANLNY